MAKTEFSLSLRRIKKPNHFCIEISWCQTPGSRLQRVDGKSRLMSPTDAIDRLLLLKALVEPAASVTTDRLFRELMWFLQEIKYDRKNVAEGTPETSTD